MLNGTAMKHVVGVGDMKISEATTDSIVTYALGSCLGITIYDPVARIGGMLHAMLPLSTIDPEKARNNPSMFIDTGVPRLFHECYKAGAARERLIVKAAGGASTSSELKDDFFQIGRRNFTLLRKLLWKSGLLLQAHDVGGTVSRTMSLEIETGAVLLKINGTETRL